MKDQFDLNRRESVFLAKKLVADVIHCGIRIEGSKLTFPETQTILDGVNVPNATLDDIQAILNMRDAWRFVLASLDEPFSLDYACKVNAFVARNESIEWGVLRTGNVTISGTKYIPPIPKQESVEEGIYQILHADMPETEKALTYFVWGAKRKFFWNKNICTSLICANKILLQSGKGLLSIKDTEIAEFNMLLTQYYEETCGDACKKQLIQFLYDNSIYGITYPPKEQAAPTVEQDTEFDKER